MGDAKVKMMGRKEYNNSFLGERVFLPENYLYYCRYVENVNVEDLLFAFIEILSPEFVIHQGKTFIKNRFNSETINEYETVDKAQFWINSILVSDLYSAEIDNEKIDILANLIADNLNLSMRKQGLHGVAKIFRDDEFGDVIVSIVDG